jgi:phosphatidylserine decarboxylase
MQEVPTPLHLVMLEFQQLIATDPVVRMLLAQAIEQAREEWQHTATPSFLKDTGHMVTSINAVLSTAPEFNETGLVGFPINAIVASTMSTAAGAEAYRNEKVNAIFRKILQTWCAFLNSPASLHVLNSGPNGWKSIAKQLHMEDYNYEPEEEHWGFKSWNDFFTRTLKPGVRPIASPNDPHVITSCCDSRVYSVSHNVQLYEQFWVKEHVYSLNDMLANDPCASEFVGGDVYQAFLSAKNYHRWHSPVAGTIKRAFIQPGFYYSGRQQLDPCPPDDSQTYISHVAARGIILIEAAAPVGLVAVIPIGMAEVSSNVLLDHIKPGYGKFSHIPVMYCELHRLYHYQTSLIELCEAPLQHCSTWSLKSYSTRCVHWAVYMCSLTAYCVHLCPVTAVYSYICI